MEIVSPGDGWRQVAAKVGEYLTAEGGAVWVVDPARQAVTLHLPDRPPTTLGRGETLEGDPYLPNLRLPVADLFASETPLAG